MSFLCESFFTKIIRVNFICISLKVFNRDIVKLLKPYLLKRPKLLPIAFINDLSKFISTQDIQDISRNRDQSTFKLALFCPNKVRTIEQLPWQHLKRHGLVMDSEPGTKRDVELTLAYENQTLRETLSDILAAGDTAHATVPATCSGYSRVGHIIHLNLRVEHLPLRHQIGQVFLDKCVGARTVVNKTETIDNEFRNLQFEVLAGATDMVTEVRENGATFRLDFSQVYWNPRLGTERARIVNSLPAGCILLDVFAGVGPFAIEAAKRKCCLKIYANDLNPESFRWLRENVARNRVPVQTFNMDGRQFIREQIRHAILQHAPTSSGTQPTTSDFFVIMNLPASSLDFVGDFLNLLPEHTACIRLTVYLYMFGSRDCGRHWLLAELSSRVGADVADGDVSDVHEVRDVAPNKSMFCLTWHVPAAILCT